MPAKGAAFEFLQKIGRAVFGARAESLKNETQDLGGDSTIKTESPLAKALGGHHNIKGVSLVAGTRLRVQISQESLIDEAALKAEGVLAIIKINPQNIHLLVGSRASEYFKSLTPNKEN